MTRSIDEFGGEDVPSVDVHQGQWDLLAGEGIIETGGLGPCMGVSVYDPDTRKAFLEHVQPVSVPINTEVIVANFPDLKRVRVWLGGAVVNRETAYNEKAREDVVDMLISLGVARSQIRTAWLDSDTEIAYGINVATGEEFVDVSDPDEHDEHGYIDDEFDDDYNPYEK